MSTAPPSTSGPQKPPSRPAGLPRPWLFLWGAGGVVLLLLQALARLAPIAWEPISEGMLTISQVAIYGAWVIVNAYLEGYRGFQKKFVPRVLARAHHLATHPSPVRGLLAPLYAMAFFDARRRALISSWMITTFVVLVVLMIRHVPQPWRGIIDGGVVVGLGWGTVHLAIGIFRRLLGEPPSGDPDLAQRHQIANGNTENLPLDRQDASLSSEPVERSGFRATSH